MVNLDKVNRLKLPTPTNEPCINAVENFTNEFAIAKDICLGKKGSR